MATYKIRIRIRSTSNAFHCYGILLIQTNCIWNRLKSVDFFFSFFFLSLYGMCSVSVFGAQSKANCGTCNKLINKQMAISAAVAPPHQQRIRIFIWYTDIDASQTISHIVAIIFDLRCFDFGEVHQTKMTSIVNISSVCTSKYLKHPQFKRCACYTHMYILFQ